MKNLNIILIMLALIGGFTACNDALNVVNPNNQTTYDFGESEAELQEAVIACYNRVGCRTWRRSVEFIPAMVSGVRQSQLTGND